MFPLAVESSAAIPPLVLIGLVAALATLRLRRRTAGPLGVNVPLSILQALGVAWWAIAAWGTAAVTITEWGFEHRATPMAAQVVESEVRGGEPQLRYTYNTEVGVKQGSTGDLGIFVMGHAGQTSQAMIAPYPLGAATAYVDPAAPLHVLLVRSTPWRTGLLVTFILAVTTLRGGMRYLRQNFELSPLRATNRDQ